MPKHMKLYIYFSTLLLLGTTAWADPPAKHNLEFKESQKVILSVDDDGVSTTDLHLNSKDDSVFFLNQSSNSLLSLEINFGKKPTRKK